jgi:hypothetical protein
MSDESLTGRERAVLFALMAVASEISNPELRARTGLDLTGPSRLKLNDLKLVESRTLGRSLAHELTDRGWARCRAIMSEPLPGRTDSGGKAMHAVFEGLDRFLRRANLQLADVFTVLPNDPDAYQPGEVIDVDARIRAAYAALTPEPGAWVRLAHLRRHLEEIVQADLDAALGRLNRASDVVIAPDSDQRRLTPEDRAAALRIGGEDKHLLMIEAR